jgi:hypothetical protein
MKQHRRYGRILYLSGCFLFTACILLPSTTFALEADTGSKAEPQAKTAVTKTEVIGAIEKAKILPTGIGLSADVIKDQIAISTYRHARATEDDCKMEAALMAKAVIDLAPSDVSRVTVYFYSMANPTAYREVAVTAGDVKAFGVGETTEKQFISSLKLVQPTLSAGERRLLEQLALAQGPEIKSEQTNDVLTVQSKLPSNLPTDDYQLEAFRIARKALSESDQNAVKKVQLTLQDPVKDSATRTMNFSARSIMDLSAAVSNIFNQEDVSSPEKPFVSIVQSFPSNEIVLEKLTTAPGDLAEERKQVLQHIRALNDQGVGVMPFAQKYLDVEDEVGKVSAEQLKTDVTSLADSLDKQDERYVISKEIHPFTGKKGPENKSGAAAATNQAWLNPTVQGNRLNSNDPKVVEAEILKDPNGLIAYFEKRLSRRGHPGELHPNFPTILDFFAVTLRKNDRIKEAVKFEERAAALRAMRAADQSKGNTTGQTQKDNEKGDASSSKNASTELPPAKQQENSGNSDSN